MTRELFSEDLTGLVAACAGEPIEAAAEPPGLGGLDVLPPVWTQPRSPKRSKG